MSLVRPALGAQFSTGSGSKQVHHTGLYYVSSVIYSFMISTDCSFVVLLFFSLCILYYHVIVINSSLVNDPTIRPPGSIFPDARGHY